MIVVEITLTPPPPLFAIFTVPGWSDGMTVNLDVAAFIPRGRYRLALKDPESHFGDETFPLFTFAKVGDLEKDDAVVPGRVLS